MANGANTSHEEVAEGVSSKASEYPGWGCEPSQPEVSTPLATGAAPSVTSSGAVARDRDHEYQLQRAGILSSAVGRARLYLREGNPEAAQEALDKAAQETRALLERLLPLFNTDRLALPEEARDV